MKNKLSSLLIITLLVLMTTIVIVPQQSTANGVLIDPEFVEEDLKPGCQTLIDKTLTTPTIPPNPDIYFLCDTTGSMWPIIENISNNATNIMNYILSIAPDAHFGVGNYKDFPYDAYPFMHQQSLTTDTVAVQAAIDAWAASGGSDGSEAQFYALTNLSIYDGIGWRENSTKIVVWFGDAPGHDPIPMAATGYTWNITEGTVIQNLTDAGIKVVAISNVTHEYYPDALDDDPTANAGDYNVYGGSYAADGSSGQATRIAAATGGTHLTNLDAEYISETILDALEDVTTDIWWEMGFYCGCGVNVELNPAVYYDIPGNTELHFDETIHVDDFVTGGTYTCTVDFYSGDYDTKDGGVVATETITVHVGKSVNLKADQVIDVGNVTVWDNGTHYFVRYTTDDDWYLCGIHLHLTNETTDVKVKKETYPDVPDVPMKNGNPIPGQFDYSESFDYEDHRQACTIEIPMSSFGEGFDPYSDEIFIAAHACVFHITHDCEYIVSDTSTEFWNESSAQWEPSFLCYVNPAWPSMLDASWIWRNETTDGIWEYDNVPYYDGEWGWNFSREFSIPETAHNIIGEINITADNSYNLSVNDEFIGKDGTMSRDGPSGNQEWKISEIYNLSNSIIPGDNGFDIRAVNYLRTQNDAGLLYRADICYDYIDREETGWGYGPEFPGSNWATYFNYSAVECTCPDPILINGGFEEPVLDPVSWDLFTEVPGWTIEWADNVIAPDPAYLEIHNQFWTPLYELEQYVELDSGWDPDIQGEPASVAISQMINTCPEQEYTISFAYSPRPKWENNSLEVYWDGILVNSTGNIPGSTETTPTLTWNSVTIGPFESSDTSYYTELKFVETGVPDCKGMLLDDVDVQIDTP